MKTCPNCGSVISSELEFCPVCGTCVKGSNDEEKKCPVCGNIIASESEICPKCGTWINQSKDVEKIIKTAEENDEKQKKIEEEQNEIAEKEKRAEETKSFRAAIFYAIPVLYAMLLVFLIMMYMDNPPVADNFINPLASILLSIETLISFFASPFVIWFSLKGSQITQRIGVLTIAVLSLLFVGTAEQDIVFKNCIMLCSSAAILCVLHEMINPYKTY